MMLKISNILCNYNCLYPSNTPLINKVSQDNWDVLNFPKKLLIFYDVTVRLLIGISGEESSMQSIGYDYFLIHVAYFKYLG